MAEVLMAALTGADSVPEGRRWQRRDAGWVAACVATATVIVLADGRTALTIVIATGLAIVSFSNPVVGLSVLVATVPVQDEWPARIGSMELPWTRVALAVL